MRCSPTEASGERSPRRLGDDIGNHPALILRNHGLLTVGESA
ncbi:class II aldolase/adducin family protein, partial [Streptomyces sp. NPDC001937]